MSSENPHNLENLIAFYLRSRNYTKTLKCLRKEVDSTFRTLKNKKEDESSSLPLLQSTEDIISGGVGGVSGNSSSSSTTTSSNIIGDNNNNNNNNIVRGGGGGGEEKIGGIGKEKEKDKDKDKEKDYVLTSAMLEKVLDNHREMMIYTFGPRNNISSGLGNGNIRKNGQWYLDCFKYLYSWISNCLDEYRIELIKLLYPLFVQMIIDLLLSRCYIEANTLYTRYCQCPDLLHGHEVDNTDMNTLYYFIQMLRSNEKKNENQIWQLLKEHSLYKRFRFYKWQIRLSQISHNLLISWLHHNDFYLLLELINDHISFRFDKIHPDIITSTSSTSTSTSTPTSASTISTIGLNSNNNTNNPDTNDLSNIKLQWGVLRDFDRIETQACRDRKSTLLGGGSGGITTTTTTTTGSGIGGLGLKSNINKRSREELTELSDSLPLITKEMEKTLYNEIRHRVYVGPDKLPSICSYSVLNSFDRVSCVRVSTDGRFIVAGTSYGKIEAFDASDSHKKYSLIGHKQSVHSLHWSSDRRLLLSAASDSTLRLWNMNLDLNNNIDNNINTNITANSSGQTDDILPIAMYRGHKNGLPIWSACISPLSLYCVSGSADRTVRLWSTERTTPLRVFAGHLSDVNTVAFHPNCNYVMSGSYDRNIRLWDIQNGKCVRLMTGHEHKINNMAVTGDGRCLVSTSSDGHIGVYDIGTGKCLVRFRAHETDATHVALAYAMQPLSVLNTKNEISSQFPLIISAGMDENHNSIRFWDVNKITTSQKPMIKSVNVGKLMVGQLEMTQSNLLFMCGVQ